MTAAPVNETLELEIERTAMSLALQHNLIAEDGTVCCWRCIERAALLPSLHCHVCLAEARRRLNLGVGLCVNRAQKKDHPSP